MTELRVVIEPLSMILGSLPKSVELGTLSTTEVINVSSIEDAEVDVSEAASRSL